MSGDPSKEVLDAVDERLRDIDDEEISHGRPPLSVLVRHANGRVGQAFWDTVKKHGLRRDGETDDQVVARLEKEAFHKYGVRLQ